MKTVKKNILCIFILALTSLFLTACGYEWEVDLRDPVKPVITARTFYTDKELATDTGILKGEEETGQTLMEALLEKDPELELVEGKKDGEKYKVYVEKFIKSSDSESPYSYINSKTNEETYVSDTRIITVQSGKAELYNYCNYITDSSSMSGSLDESYNFYDLKVILPFKVYYTNGTKTGKKIVVFDKSFGQSEERSVAVASKKIYDVTKITVNIEKTDYDEYGNRIVISSKKYKEGKKYKVGDRISISSKNAIKVFTINGDNIAENSYTFRESGKYNVRIVLANDTVKEMKITVK